MAELFRRELYLERLRPFYDTDLIKVVTGMRRCGKSCLMQTVMEELRERGVGEDRITYLDLDARRYRRVRDPDTFDKAIEAAIGEDPRGSYLFVDEVQNVEGFEEVVEAWRLEGVSIFITGSNSYLLSGELATKLTGRYVELELFTLAFPEWLGMREALGEEIGPTAAEFERYLREGGMPGAVRLPNPTARAAYVADVIAQVIEKDVSRRAGKVRNAEAFRRVMTYMVSNYAAPTNFANIAEELREAQGTPVLARTVSRYAGYLEAAKVLYRCPTFDLKSRRSLHGGEKHYLADLSLYYALNTDNQVSYGPALENVVYQYLRRHGWTVSVGRVGRLEVDFIARKDQRYVYVQVSMSIVDQNVEEREFRPFSLIRDGWPRYLLTLDPLPTTRDGVTHLNIAELMASDADL